MPGDEKGGMLRHFLAALAYRTQKALRDAPGDFADFDAGNNVRTPNGTCQRQWDTLRD